MPSICCPVPSHFHHPLHTVLRVVGAVESVSVAVGGGCVLVIWVTIRGYEVVVGVIVFEEVVFFYEIVCVVPGKGVS